MSKVPIDLTPSGFGGWHREVRYSGGVKDLVPDAWVTVAVLLLIILVVADVITPSWWLRVPALALGLGLMVLSAFEGTLARRWDQRFQGKGR